MRNYLNSKVLLSKAVSCDSLPEEIWCSQQMSARERLNTGYNGHGRHTFRRHWVFESVRDTFVLVLSKGREESWFTNLEQTPLNRCQQLPAPYKRLIADNNKTDKH